MLPPETPVTRPVLETVGTAVLEEVHGLVAAAVPDPVNWVVPPTQTLNVPVIVAPDVMVTSCVIEQPFEFV